MMPGHLSKTSDKIECKVCGKILATSDPAHYITGFGTICMPCSRKYVKCENCGSDVRLMTITVLRGRKLCLLCYKQEREKGEKRIVKEVNASSLDDLIQVILANTPDGFRFIGVRLKPSSKNTWQIEYEREDIFEMRCS